MWEWVQIRNCGSLNTNLLLNKADRQCIGFGVPCAKLVSYCFCIVFYFVLCAQFFRSNWEADLIIGKGSMTIGCGTQRAGRARIRSAG